MWLWKDHGFPQTPASPGMKNIYLPQGEHCAAWLINIFLVKVYNIDMVECRYMIDETYFKDRVDLLD